jgi:hypothetical protein
VAAQPHTTPHTLVAGTGGGGHSNAAYGAALPYGMLGETHRIVTSLVLAAAVRSRGGVRTVGLRPARHQRQSWPSVGGGRALRDLRRPPARNLSSSPMW